MALPSVFGGHFEFLWVAIAQSAYVYYFMLRLRKGAPRLLALLPILPFTFLVPWRAPTAAERGAISFLYLWLMLTKLLMVVWDKGPGADPSVVSSFPRFFCSMTLSLHVKSDFLPPKTSKTDNASQSKIDEPDDVPETRGSESQGGVVRRKVGSGSAVNGEVANGVSDRNTDEPKRIPKSWEWIDTAANSLSGRMVLFRTMANFLLLVAMVRTIVIWKPSMSKYATHWAHLAMMYAACLFLFEGLGAIPAIILGTELHQQFNMPFLATSIADFWGRRWNLLVNNLLRVSVYEPVLSFLSAGKGKSSTSDRAVATLMTFLVSGLEHELIFFYVNKTHPTWETTTFFVLNGLATIVEGYVRPRKRFGIPTILMRAYTLTFLFFTSAELFFPPVVNTGMIDQCLLDMQTFSFWIQNSILTWGTPR